VAANNGLTTDDDDGWTPVTIMVPDSMIDGSLRVAQTNSTGTASSGGAFPTADSVSSSESSASSNTANQSSEQGDQPPLVSGADCDQASRRRDLTEETKGTGLINWFARKLNLETNDLELLYEREE
jgi:hypothetical protein